MNEPEPSSPRPEGFPTSELSPRPEPEGSPTPEGSPSAEPELWGNSAAEPIPQWGNATATWEWAWELHYIGFGSLFTILAIFALWSTITMARERRKRRRILSIFVSSMLIIFGTSRALFLFLNPYESPQCGLPECPVLLTRILFGIGLPCLTAAFSFIQLVFLQMTKMKVYPGRVQSWKFLFSIILVHFSLALVTEIVIFSFADWKSLSIVCQAFFIVFSFVLSVSFTYTGRKIIQYVNTSARHVSRMGQRNETRILKDAENKTKHYGPNVAKLVKITYMTAALGFVSCALQLYSIFVVFNMYKDEYIEPEPWPWWVFQTLYRVVELAAGCTMAYVSPRQTSNAVFSWWYALLCCCRGARNQAVFYQTDTTDETSQKNGKYEVGGKPRLQSKLSQVELIELDNHGIVLSAQTL